MKLILKRPYITVKKQKLKANLTSKIIKSGGLTEDFEDKMNLRYFSIMSIILYSNYV